MLEFDRVSVRVRGVPLLRDVSLKLAPGDFVALLGPNGAGKTTLIRTALGLLPAAEGRVRLGGQDVRRLSGRQRAAQAAWLPQHHRFHEEVSALDLAAAARFRFIETRQASLDAARAALTRAGAAEFAARLVSRLSGGEQQRVAFGCLLAQQAPLLLLDEPANHLDPAQQVSLYRLIGDCWQQGLGVLCITHDVNLLAHAARGRESSVRILGVQCGSLAFESRLDAPDLGPRLSELFGLRLGEARLEGRRVFLPAEVAP
ncbi:ABC transporter ATP-binding protein [bacterium]|nr:MAG: ABC transporter ATP-binding protein [bacterium]RIK61789.1 MAG: ABC transporter ATP-binding protein [Planctomycetota bacterium]